VTAADSDTPTAIRCKNGHLVGVEVAGLHIVRHAGRIYTGVLFSATCKCGASWTNVELAPLMMRALHGMPAALEAADIPLEAAGLEAAAR
jgi:hypothetical protein